MRKAVGAISSQEEILPAAWTTQRIDIAVFFHWLMSGRAVITDGITGIAGNIERGKIVSGSFSPTIFTGI